MAGLVRMVAERNVARRAGLRAGSDFACLMGVSELPSAGPAPKRADPDAVVDVIIVGAGLTGASTAVVLGRAGWRVVLVDPHPSCPAWFKAEKIEPDQADLLRELGLLDAVAGRACRIHRVTEAVNGRVLRVVPVEQYGIAYRDFVNAVRESLPPAVETRTDRVVAIDLTPFTQRVQLGDGEELRARLVVLATGTGGGRLLERVGVAKGAINGGHSLSIGFDLEPVDGRPFPFEALTYFPSSPAAHVAYLSVFPMTDRTRANFFVYRDPKDPWVRAFITDPVGQLGLTLPGLTRVTGDFRVTSKVEVTPTHLYRVTEPRKPGVAIVGDACQSVDPVTGTGVSKLLTDVVELTALVPRWLATPGMGAEKVGELYDSPRKARADDHSLRAGLFHRRKGQWPALRWRASYVRWLATTRVVSMITALLSLG
jgi:2-polyprenyl-6-methoxyphenol hydroxylase-like FAD-dependent oxidoreductase